MDQKALGEIFEANIKTAFEGCKILMSINAVFLILDLHKKIRPVRKRWPSVTDSSDLLRNNHAEYRDHMPSVLQRLTISSYIVSVIMLII